MAQDSDKAVRVGEYIRQHIIPAGMSVKEAASRLGVGRPALSNLLNGNAALSPDMAVRLEKSFGAGSPETPRHASSSRSRKATRGGKSCRRSQVRSELSEHQGTPDRNLGRRP